MRRKKVEAETTTPSGQGRITPADVQQVEFRLAFRGYNERDVDAFLDRVTEDLAAYEEENERLRAAGPVTGAAADDAARREAERIVADARAEAERIIGEARTLAATMAAPSVDARSALAPFLSKERAFLQSLGALVQGHAEEVKGMVLAARSASEPASGARDDADRSATEAEERAPTGALPSQEAGAVTTSEGEGAGEDAPATTAEEAFAPITVPDAQEEEPRDDPAPAQLRRDSGERSLRELFWGED